MNGLDKRDGYGRVTHIAVRVSEGLHTDRYEWRPVTPPMPPREPTRHRMNELTRECRDCHRSEVWIHADREHLYEPCIPDLVVATIPVRVVPERKTP